MQVGEPAAAAALTAGLRPRALSKAELRRFAQRTQPYLEARNAILLKWAANPAAYLTAEACIGETSDAHQQINLASHAASLRQTEMAFAPPCSLSPGEANV
jgi:hypothetical protein